MLLQFKGSDRRFFFWLQDKDGEKDTELIGKMNDILNGVGAEESPVPAATATPASAAAPAVRTTRNPRDRCHFSLVTACIGLGHRSTWRSYSMR